MKLARTIFILAGLCFSNSTIAQTIKPLPYTGVNLSGGEFGTVKPDKPRVFAKDYIYPAPSEVDYFLARGMNVFRIPFRWESLQPKLGKPLDAVELSRLSKLVHYITDKHAVAILDPHNYARYYDKPVGSAEVSNDQFGDFWRQLSLAYENDDYVWFGLVNEPHDIPAGQWLAAANSAIASIRKTGAKNQILVPGIAWTGAHSWLSSGNAASMLKIEDPANRFVFEVHQYLDADSSGTTNKVMSPTIGVDRLQQFTDWCKVHHYKAFLGELAAADLPLGHQAIDNMLTAIEKSPDVWIGYTWWSAGPWWWDYMFTLEPTANHTDRPQLLWLKPHLHSQFH